LTLDATTVFTLNVSQRIDNEEFHAQQQVTVSVGPPPAPKAKIQKFHGSVALDGSQLQLTLSWITEIADQITLTHVNGFQKPSDTLILRPTTRDPLANTYTLEARKGQEAVTSTISIVWVGSKSVPVVFSPQDCAILPDGSRLFATGGFANSVTVLDPLTLAKVPGSPFSLGERTNPQGIAASPDSTRVYVGSIYPKNRLWGYDSRTFKAVSGSPAETGGAYHMAVTPDNQSIYVSGDFDVQVFATSNMKLLRSIRVGNTPQGIAFTPDSSRAFVAIGGDDEVCVIDNASGNKIGTLKVGARPISAAVTPDGKQLYVGNQGSSSVSVFDPATLQQLPGSPIGVRGGPLRLAPSRDGKRMFVLSAWGPRLNVIDTSTRTLVGGTDIGSGTTGLAVSPDGVRVYVLLRSSNQMWMFLPTATGGTG
jgi:YVTN family beta-propeller protein